MTTYLLITSDKPTELKASTDGKNWLPVLNASIRDSVHGLSECKILFGLDGPIEVKLDAPVELEGWELDKVYQVMNPELDIYWENRSEVDYNGFKAIPGYFTRVAYRLKRSESVNKIPEGGELFASARERMEEMQRCSHEYHGPSVDGFVRCHWCGTPKESPIEAKTQEIDHDGKLDLPWFLQPYTDRYTNIIRSVKNPGMIVASCSMSRTQAEFIVEQCNKLYESYKTQESQTDLWNDLINLYDTTDRSSYGYASLVKALSEKFILTRRNH